MRSTLRGRTARLVVAFALLSGLVGCSQIVASAGEQSAQKTVAEVARSISFTRQDDIDAFARAAVTTPSMTNGDVTLIDITSRHADRLQDTFGRLTFLVQIEAADRGFGSQPSGGPYCFGVDFNRYGYRGQAGTKGVDPVPCPNKPKAVVPPIDTKIRAIVVPNARDVAHQVLDALPAGGVPSAQKIAQAIVVSLAKPEGKYERAAQPTVAVKGDDVGVAMGAGPKDCVLVARIGGVVQDIYSAPVHLQPGENGCFGETALLDPSQLKPPH